MNERLGIIFLSSDDDLMAAAECVLLMGDGTFEICPNGFAQLYTVHGLVNFVCVCIIYFYCYSFVENGFQLRRS